MPRRSSSLLRPPSLCLQLPRLSLSRCLPQRCLRWPPPILCRALTSQPSGELRGQSLMRARASVPCSRAAFQLRTPRGPLLATLLYRTRVTRPVACHSTRPPFRPLAPRQLLPSGRFRSASPRRAALATGPWISRRLQRCHARSVAALGMALQPLLHRLFPSARARRQQLPRRPVLRVPGRALRLLRAWCAGLALLGRACSRSSLLRRCGLRRCSSSLCGCHTPLSRSASWVLPLGVACLPPLARGGAFQSAASRSTAARFASSPAGASSAAMRARLCVRTCCMCLVPVPVAIRRAGRAVPAVPPSATVCGLRCRVPSMCGLATPTGSPPSTRAC